MLLVNKYENSYRALDLPSNWLYYSPAFSPNGRMVAFVRQDKDKKNNQQIVIVPAKWLTASKDNLSFEVDPVVTNNHNFEITNLSWSPDGSKLAYSTIDHYGAEKVWIVEKGNNPHSQMVAKGINPTWSPDGSRMIIQRSGILYMLDVKSGKEIKLGQGEQPVWCSSGYIAFVSTRQQEKVLTFMPDGSPQFTVHRLVGEIRSVYAGKNGDLLWNSKKDNWLASSTMLASPGGRSTHKEMEWLRQLELQGVREPRILMLDEVDRCHNPVLLGDENTLYYIHQGDIYASLMQVKVKEQLFGKGEK
ncbi:MAG: PD40 domain-containing protein [Desulfotomaculum sp.]|nr:PD40 domain-containing protein [Desulfotomaculum sp.]